MSIEDVTARVNAAVKPGSSLADAYQARRAAMNTSRRSRSKRPGCGAT